MADNMQNVDAERAKFIKDIQDQKAQYERELRADPNDPAAKENLRRVNSVLERYGVQLANEDNSKMKDGGMARGKGGKMYQHNYATGGSVTDHLKKVPADNKGLSKLPKDVRNKMGYMSYGGMAKKKGKK